MSHEYCPSPIPGFADPFSAMSHLLGAAVMAVATVPLVRRGRGKTAHWLALLVFSFSGIFLLSMSGVYHLLSPNSDGREVLQRLDHAAIFVLIAGSFCAPHTILFRGFMRWGILLFVWTCAITGLTLKTIFFHSIPESLGLTLYLGLGWFGIVSGVALWRRYGFRAMRYIFYGGFAYTIGGLLEFFRYPVLIDGVIGPHELFHVAVLFGIGFHWKFAWDAANPSLFPAAWFESESAGPKKAKSKKTTPGLEDWR